MAKLDRLTLDRIDALTADLPPGERDRARILLACKLIRRELRALRREVATERTL